MSVEIEGYASIQALPADFVPEVDSEGYPLDDALCRAEVPEHLSYALADVEGGTDADPHNPGFLGSRWYRILGPCGSTFSMSSSRLTSYREDLAELAASSDLEDAFGDLIRYNSSLGILGPAACRRLAAAYKKHPYLYGETQVHNEINEMIHDIAAAGGVLVFNG